MIDEIEPVGFVETEGGPIVLLDGKLAAQWNGIDGDDYERACNIFDIDNSIEGGSIKIDNDYGLVWETRGAGSVNLFIKKSGEIVGVRVWPIDPLDDLVSIRMASAPSIELNYLGNLKIRSERILVIWATENGNCVKPSDLLKGGRPSGIMALDAAALIIKTSVSEFKMFHDELKTVDGVARRFHMRPL